METRLSRLFVLLGIMFPATVWAQPAQLPSPPSQDATPVINRDTLFGNLVYRATAKVFSFSDWTIVGAPVKREVPGIRYALLLPDLSHGTAFVVTPDCVAVTAGHVVRDALFLFARFESEGKPRRARVLWRSKVHDLALIKIEGPGCPGYLPLDRLPALPDSPRGKNVRFYGFPRLAFEDEVSVMAGIVSRFISAKGWWEIAAPVNPGHSGGPAFLENGALLGMVVARLGGSQNMGYVIPAVVIREALLRHGRDGSPSKGGEHALFSAVERLFEANLGEMKKMMLSDRREDTVEALQRFARLWSGAYERVGALEGLEQALGRGMPKRVARLYGGIVYNAEAGPFFSDVFDAIATLLMLHIMDGWLKGRPVPEELHGFVKGWKRIYAKEMRARFEKAGVAWDDLDALEESEPRPHGELAQEYRRAADLLLEHVYDLMERMKVRFRRLERLAKALRPYYTGTGLVEDEKGNPDLEKVEDPLRFALENVSAVYHGITEMYDEVVNELRPDVHRVTVPVHSYLLAIPPNVSKVTPWLVEGNLVAQLIDDMVNIQVGDGSKATYYESAIDALEKAWWGKVSFLYRMDRVVPRVATLPGWLRESLFVEGYLSYWRAFGYEREEDYVDMRRWSVGVGAQLSLWLLYARAGAGLSITDLGGYVEDTTTKRHTNLDSLDLGIEGSMEAGIMFGYFKVGVLWMGGLTSNHYLPSYRYAGVLVGVWF